MRSKVADRILANTPEEVKIFTDLYADLIVRINTILKEKGINQKSLAEKLDKSPSEIHRWLSGDHNFTLRSIAKLQAELGEPLLEVPQTPKHSSFVTAQGRTTFKIYVNNNRNEISPKWESEVSFRPNKALTNVG